MESTGSNYGGSEQFRNYQGGFVSPVASSHSTPQYEGLNHILTIGYQFQNFQYTGFQQVHPIGFQLTLSDPREVYVKRKDGLTKLRNIGVVNLFLAVLTIAVGVSILVVASSNIGFPVFNVGVLLVGILHVFTGMWCFLAGIKGLNSISETSLEIPHSIKCYIVAQFVISVALITLAILAAVFAFISGAACAGADVKFESQTNNQVKEIDVKQYCEPHKNANSAFAFFGGGLCILIAIMSIYGPIWICFYGTLFGWKRTGQGLSYP